MSDMANKTQESAAGEYLDYEEALQRCQEGKSSEDLRELYRMPYRERVPWGLFPSWARPNDPVEGGHEGGNI